MSAGGSLQRTGSFGVATVPHSRIRDCDGLVRAADDALYVAKETGRNRVILFDSAEFNAHTGAPDGDRTSASTGAAGGGG